MKRKVILSIGLILMFALSGYSQASWQNIQPLGTNKTTIDVKNAIIIDSVLKLPIIAPSAAKRDTGVIYYLRSDSSLNVWAGTAFIKFKVGGGGSGGGSDSGLIARYGINISRLGSNIRIISVDSGLITSRERSQKLADSLTMNFNALLTLYKALGDTVRLSGYTTIATKNKLADSLTANFNSLITAYKLKNDSAALGGYTTIANKNKLADSLTANFNALLSLYKLKGDSISTSGYTTVGHTNKVADSLRLVFNTLLGAKQDTGLWNLTGNYISPAIPVSDSVAIGGTTPTHRLHLIGDAAFDYSNPDSTKSSLSAFQYIARQTKGGGTGLTFNNLYIASQINSGDSVANMNEVTVDPGSVNGKALNWTAYKVLAGTFPNIGNYIGVDVQNPASVGTAIGVKTNITVGGNSYSMYHGGSAKSFIFGQLGLNNIVPAASARLDIVDTARGILIPRVTNTQMLAIASPASYLMVFNSDSSAAITGGLYYYDPLLTQWRPVNKSTGAGSQTLPQVLATGRTLTKDSILLNELYFKGGRIRMDTVRSNVTLKPAVKNLWGFGTSIMFGAAAYSDNILTIDSAKRFLNIV